MAKSTNFIIFAYYKIKQKNGKQLNRIYTMLTQIYNGHILTPQGWIDGGSVLIENGLITEVRKSSNIDPNADKTIDAKGLHVVPGGIELHCHGGGGGTLTVRL